MSNVHGSTADQRMLAPEGYKALYQRRGSTEGETWPTPFVFQITIEKMTATTQIMEAFSTNSHLTLRATDRF